MIAMTFLIQPFAAQARPQFCLAKTGLDVGDWFETGFALGKAGTVMIAFGNHYTTNPKERQNSRFLQRNGGTLLLGKVTEILYSID